MTWWKNFFSTAKVIKNPDNLTVLFTYKFFVNKLRLKFFSFFLEKEQTNPKQINVPSGGPKPGKGRSSQETTAGTEETEETGPETDTDESEEDDTELTKPKTLSCALRTGSNSRPETATDSDLPPLPDRVGTSLFFSNEDDTSKGTSLPVRVGTSLPPISNGSSGLSTNLNESNKSLPLPDQVGVTLSNAEETDQTTANTERMRGDYILNRNDDNTGSLTTDMVEELLKELDADVERSLHRNDSTFYQGQYYNILCILKT